MRGLFISQVDLDFVYFTEDLFGVGFKFGAEDFDFAAVVGLVEDHVLFEVGKLNVNFC